MKKAARLGDVPAAYKNSAVARRALHLLKATPMECTEDKAGIVWERFVLPTGRSIVLFATPYWWDIFSPISDDGAIKATLEALEKLAEGG